MVISLKTNISISLTFKGRKVSDYALMFAMVGVLLMIIETEFSMSKLYEKVGLYLSFIIYTFTFNLSFSISFSLL